jgi:hypothetical protein
LGQAFHGAVEHDDIDGRILLYAGQRGIERDAVGVASRFLASRLSAWCSSTRRKVCAAISKCAVAPIHLPLAYQAHVGFMTSSVGCSEWPGRSRLR